MAKLYTSEVLKRLGITRVTLGKWVLQGKLKAIRKVVAGIKYREFDENEVNKLAARKVKNPVRGKPLLVDKKAKKKPK